MDANKSGRCFQRYIQNSVDYLRWNFFVKIANCFQPLAFFTKRLHSRCLAATAFPNLVMKLCYRSESLLIIFRFPVTNFLPKFLQILFFNKYCLVFPRILESLAQLSNLFGLSNSVETVVIALYFQHHPAWIYFKITDRNTRIIFKICSKLTGKTLKHQ